MMNFILDLGNTNAKLALTDLSGNFRKIEVLTKISLHSIKTFINDNPGIDSCILSSVIRHPASVSNFLKKHFRFIELTDETPLPVRNLYHTPKELGNDRLAAVAGAAALYPGEDVLVIVAGSCITYNIITSRKEFYGGAISPGLNMRLQALHTFTDKLPLIQFKEIDDPIGRTTEQSILSGVINGIVAEMEGFTSLYREKYPGMKVILSGGDLKHFDNRLKISIFAVPNIVLFGLHQILTFNV
jgi:type III pantothenate kinase